MAWDVKTYEPALVTVGSNGHGSRAKAEPPTPDEIPRNLKSGDYIDRSRTTGDNRRESGLLRDLNYKVRLIPFVVFRKITEANHRLESCLIQ